jgi:hypothetical protein
VLLLKHDPEVAEHLECYCFIPQERPPPLKGAIVRDGQGSKRSESTLFGTRQFTGEQPLCRVGCGESPGANGVSGGKIERVHEAPDIDSVQLGHADDLTRAYVYKSVLACAIEPPAPRE